MRSLFSHVGFEKCARARAKTTKAHACDSSALNIDILLYLLVFFEKNLIYQQAANCVT